MTKLHRTFQLAGLICRIMIIRHSRHSERSLRSEESLFDLPFAPSSYAKIRPSGAPTLPLELALIPANSRLESTADGPSLPIADSESRTFFCTLTVSDQIEQESLDVSIWGSSDGQNFGKRPILKFPQQFYCGTTKLVLDVSLRPDVKFLRARY